MGKQQKFDKCNYCTIGCKNVYVSTCRIFGYYKRKNFDVKIEEGWSKDEYDLILKHFFLDEIKNEYIMDDIVLLLNKKTVSDLISLLRNVLHIGNKKLLFKTHCANCGVDILRATKDYDKGRLYCSMDCRNIYKSTNHIHSGDKNGRYNSFPVNCTSCQKTFIVPEYKLHMKNRDGVNNLFCSKKCYYEFRKNYYVFDKSNFYNYIHDNYDDFCKMQQMACLNNHSKNIYKQTNTLPHRNVCDFLTSNNIKFECEKIIGYYSVDIITRNLVIEIMGDYWHASPCKYKEYEKLNDIQKKDVIRDKRKRTYLSDRNYNILYLWESDINKDFVKCTELIKLFLEKENQILPCHSFNYKYSENLKVLENLIIPFQNLKNTKYQKSVTSEK